MMKGEKNHNNQKILATGFDRFGHLGHPNPSSEVVLPALEKEYGELIETLVLPTARDIASEQLSKAIKELNPVAVIMFGVSAGRKVRLEQIARNRNMNVLIPDNNGIRRVGRIENNGQKTLPSTLPLEAIYVRLESASIPVRFSKSAGSFVCNEVMYKALHEERERGDMLPTGFIHLGNGLSDQLTEEAALLVVDELLRF